MTIQTINLGAVPLGVGGDSLRSTAAKINANFTDATNAASKTVGIENGQIPLAENIKALLKNPDNYTNTTTENSNVVVTSTGELKRSTATLGTAATKNIGVIGETIPLAKDVFNALANTPTPLKSYSDPIYNNLNLHPIGSKVLIDSAAYFINAPPAVAGNLHYIIETNQLYNDDDIVIQTATAYSLPVKYIRTANRIRTWSRWVAVSETPLSYQNTTIEMPNVAVDSNGELKRSKIVSKSIVTAVAIDTLSQTIPTGVSPVNILSVEVKVQSNYGEIMKSGYSGTSGYFFDWFVANTGAVSITTQTDKTHIRNGFFKIYLTYQN